MFACRFKRVIWALSACFFSTAAQISFAGQMPESPHRLAQSCQLSIDQEVLDYGSFTAGNLSKTGQSDYSLDPRFLRITIICPVKTAMALKLTGPSAVNGNGALKFAAEGAVRVTISDATMDGEPIGMQAPARNGIEQSKLDVLMNDIVRFHTKDGSGAGKHLSARLRIEPMVKDSDTRIADLTTWTTQVRIDLLTL